MRIKARGEGFIMLEETRRRGDNFAIRIGFADGPYPFADRPAQRSSTSVLTNTPGKIACQGCGCRDHRRVACECICHQEGEN